MFFKRRKTTIPQIFPEEGIQTGDIIAPSSIEIKSNYLKLGERLTKTFFVFSYPRYLSTGWFSPVVNLDFPMDVSLFLHPIETGMMLRQLRKRVTEVQAEIMEKEGKGLIRDPELETAYRDLEQLRDNLTSARERMFQLAIYITVYAENEEELREMESELRSILESRLVYVKPALYQQKAGFNSSAPYGLDQLGIYTAMNTAPLSSIFPFISFDLSSSQGILYGVNQHNNSLVLFDRFSLENANSTVFGTAGSGKSVKANEPVLIKERGETKLTKIGPLVDKIIKEQGKTKIDDELEGTINPGIEVYSFNKNLKGEWSKVTVAARKKAPEAFYKFTTRSGREIVTTGDHNMLVLRNGKVVTAKSSEIKNNEYVPLPREISGIQNPPKPLNLLKLLRNSKNIYVAGAETLIRQNYKILNGANLDGNLDRYLYKYRDGRVVPIKYFWKILNCLAVKDSDQRLQELKIISRTGKNKPAWDINFPISSEFLKIAGYICAEGTVGNEAIGISNLNTEVLQDIDLALKKLKIPFYYGNRGIIIASRVAVEIIKALGGKGKSAQKKVLPAIFGLSKENAAQFLSAYFEGDGGVEHNGEVKAVSKSQQLISEINYLLYYFGIIGRVSKIKKRAANSAWKREKTYWRLTISGQENLRRFAENINFISQRKQKRLSEIMTKAGNTNVDIIPGLAPVFKEIHKIFPPLFYDIPNINDWKNGRRSPSPQRLQKAISLIEEKIQCFKDLSATFKILADLPELASIINMGKSDKSLNRSLWEVLGQSWRVVKNEGVKPGSINMFKALEVINKNPHSLEEIKTAIHTGFKEMGLEIKSFNPSLQTALVEQFSCNTNYELVQKSARFVWQSYQEVLTQKIPQIEKRLNQLKVLAGSDLFWDPIVKIEKIKNKKEKHVYDLTVDNEVFLAGQGGLFVHNSYAIKLEILRNLMLNTDVIVLDPENEYKFLSDAVGGSFLNISLGSANHINPFDLPLPRDEEQPEDVLRSNIVNLVGLLRIMLGGLTPEEDAIIDQALTETYAAKDITPDSDSKNWKENIPLMEDLEQVLETMEGTESLVIRLRKFTKGTYANFSNQPSNVSMENNLIVFGIRDMEEELRPAAMFTVMRYIWNTVRAELKKRILVIDEAWWLMKTEDGASFLFGTVKRARKYWLGVTTCTQDVVDFMKSNYGRPIITNSALQLLMKQSPATIEIVKKTFNLTDEEKNILLECPVGEGLFFAGQKHVLIRAMASYTEDQFITTAPAEVARIRKAKEGSRADASLPPRQ